VAALAAVVFLACPTLAQKVAQNEASVLEAPAYRKDIYPANADAQEDIDTALKNASHDHKRVLLVFGGNWCYDCHVLDRAMHEGTAAKIIKASFELVHVDIGEANKNLNLAEKYRIPLDKGVPALAVLDEKGTILYSSGDGEFEGARSMLKTDLVAFLERWQKNKPD
jgi:thioredoxin-related protein